MIRYILHVRGRVQGVGFRPFVYRIAVANNLNGYVRNMADGSVEILVEGRMEDIDRFVDDLKCKRPPLVEYHGIYIRRETARGDLSGFTIMESSIEYRGRELSIPPDIAICDACVNELSSRDDRRYNYFFITCTECGPRFSMIHSMPYDRVNTSMNRFIMCDDCRNEYTDPLNRRFHAESISCHRCGPSLYLLDSDGVRVDDGDPIMKTCRLLEDGKIVAIKGIGGFHIAVSAYDSDAIARLRIGKRRERKPFAVMARDIDTVKEFALVDRYEESILRSYIRPIVLLRKSKDYDLSPLVSYLHTIGVMLPYTGLHHLLFNDMSIKVIVMTSANSSNEPIIVDEKEALRKLRFVDYFLIHDRDIINGSDDSVVKVNNGNVSIIRRSRGYVPSPIVLNRIADKSVLAVGAHLNLTISLLSRDKIVQSQHIGDIESPKVYTYMGDVVEKLCRLIDVRPDIIACDMHPSIPTTSFAYRLAEEIGADIVRVQHHHAHTATLMLESSRDSMIGVVCDGNGYGLDGNVWGGEVFLVEGNRYTRVAHLMEHPMIGGDLATYYPLRMVAGILYGMDGLEEYLYERSHVLPYGRRELDSILELLSKGKYIKTSSTGRVLDAISFLLHISDRRTYEGEPAMMLESVAVDGEDVLHLDPRISSSVLDTRYLLEEIFYNMNRFKVRDLAYSAHMYIAKGLAELAVENAMRYGIDTIGFSGGVAYNEIITRVLMQEIEKVNSSIRFVYNNIVPAGDAGISVGQAYYTLILSDTVH
jgi:hydrogenase maturation protein HypF